MLDLLDMQKEFLLTHLRPGDVVLIAGAGDIVEVLDRVRSDMAGRAVR